MCLCLGGRDNALAKNVVLYVKLKFYFLALVCSSEETLLTIRAEMKARIGSSPQIIETILEYRQLNKLLTTYILPLPKICRRVTQQRSKKIPSRIYAQWIQTSTR